MTTAALPQTRPVSLSNDRRALGVAALLLGLGLIFLVGFAPISAVHNAAHDSRHTAAFPCH